MCSDSIIDLSINHDGDRGVKLLIRWWGEASIRVQCERKADTVPAGLGPGFHSQTLLASGAS